jgi:hypothetical protein
MSDELDEYSMSEEVLNELQRVTGSEWISIETRNGHKMLFPLHNIPFDTIPQNLWLLINKYRNYEQTIDENDFYELSHIIEHMNLDARNNSPITYDQMKDAEYYIEKAAPGINIMSFNENGFVYDSFEHKQIFDRYPQELKSYFEEIDDQIIIPTSGIQLLLDFEMENFPLIKPIDDTMIKDKMTKHINSLEISRYYVWENSEHGVFLSVNIEDLHQELLIDVENEEDENVEIPYQENYINNLISLIPEAIIIEVPGGFLFTNYHQIYDEIWENRIGSLLTILVAIPEFVKYLTHDIGLEIESFIRIGNLEEFLKENDLLNILLNEKINLQEVRDYIRIRSVI